MEYKAEYAERGYTGVEAAFQNRCDVWFMSRMYPESSVIDIGSGDGRLAAWLSKAGHQVSALEPSKGLHEAALARGEDFNAINATWEEYIQTNPKPHDNVIFSFGVLNHITAGDGPNLAHVLRKALTLANDSVLGWVGGRTQLGLFLKLSPEDFLETTEGDYTDETIMKTQWGEEYSAGLPVNGYKYEDLAPYFDEVRAFPKALFCLPWEEQSQERIRKALELDGLMLPNDPLASGYLVHREVQ